MALEVKSAFYTVFIKLLGLQESKEVKGSLCFSLNKKDILKIWYTALFKMFVKSM